MSAQIQCSESCNVALLALNQQNPIFCKFHTLENIMSKCGFINIQPEAAQVPLALFYLYIQKNPTSISDLKKKNSSLALDLNTFCSSSVDVTYYVCSDCHTKTRLLVINHKGSLHITSCPKKLCHLFETLIWVFPIFN